MSNFTEQMKEAAEHLSKAQSIMARGPMEYYFAKLVEHSEALLSKAPLQSGDRAVIIKKIKCDGGWRGSEKTLGIGQVGTVRDVDFRNGKYTYEFVPDEEWYEYNGEWKESESSHSYSLGENKLFKLEDEAK